MEDSATPNPKHSKETLKTQRKRAKVDGVCDMCSDGGSWGYHTPIEGERVLLALILGHVHRKLASPDLQICESCGKAMNSKKLASFIDGTSSLISDASTLIMSRAIGTQASGRLMLEQSLLNPQSPLGLRCLARTLRQRHNECGMSAFDSMLASIWSSGVHRAEPFTLLPCIVGGTITIYQSPMGTRPDGAYRFVGSSNTGELIVSELLTSRQLQIPLDWARQYSTPFEPLASEVPDLAIEATEMRKMLREQADLIERLQREAVEVTLNANVFSSFSSPDPHFF